MFFKKYFEAAFLFDEETSRLFFFATVRHSKGRSLVCTKSLTEHDLNFPTYFTVIYPEIPLQKEFLLISKSSNSQTLSVLEKVLETPSAFCF